MMYMSKIGRDRIEAVRVANEEAETQFDSPTLAWEIPGASFAVGTDLTLFL